MQSWNEFLNQESKQPYFIELMNKIEEVRKSENVYPPQVDMFSCFDLCPLDQVKVVIIGQDPYHRFNQAHGLSFSVRPGIKVPPSLKNIYKELQSDLNVTPVSHGYLEGWAKQGVLMMNTSWSVSEGKPGSHKNFGWKIFTNHVLEVLNEANQPIVFLLWGNHAIQVAQILDNPNHLLLKAAHPSPLAGGAFFGSKPFSQANAFLKAHDLTPIEWQLKEI